MSETGFDTADETNDREDFPQISGGKRSSVACLPCQTTKKARLIAFGPASVGLIPRRFFCAIFARAFQKITIGESEH